ncbi:hypothetical protein VNO77_03557 [Canavalia gladiata]|uniref:Uncharacterized protein n=1 Tax=Canavalia gladiata TaxID=3824 RepID=A0AAN9R891_CANGL
MSKERQTIEKKEGTGFLLGGFPGYWTERRISELPAEGERFFLYKFRDSRIISVALSAITFIATAKIDSSRFCFIEEEILYILNHILTRSVFLIESTCLGSQFMVIPFFLA